MPCATGVANHSASSATNATIAPSRCPYVLVMKAARSDGDA
jgi:hypothetical protein